MAYSYYQPQFYGHPNTFANAVQQPYTPQPQQAQSPQINTQVLQPATKIIQVSSKEEATGTPVDLINGTPTFFYNKGKNEIYLKQCDISSGTPIFKTYAEVQTEVKEIKLATNYEKELQHISEGVDSLHRILSQMQNSSEETEEKKNKKRGNE